MADHSALNTHEWNSTLYNNHKEICYGLTVKALKIALNQANTLTPEALEAYLDTLREVGEESWVNLVALPFIQRGAK